MNPATEDSAPASAQCGRFAVDSEAVAGCCLPVECVAKQGLCLPDGRPRPLQCLGKMDQTLTSPAVILKISKGVYGLEGCLEHTFYASRDKGFCVWFEMPALFCLCSFFHAID